MRLALGTAQFGMEYGISNVNGKVSQEDGKAILKSATLAGVDTIDTAMAYGDSEQVLGNMGVAAFNVVTKLPEIPEHIIDIEGWVINSVKDSVCRLRVERLYGLLLHRPDQLFEPKGFKILSALRLLKDSGLVRNVGISVSSPGEFDALFNIYDFDIVQCPFNLVDRRLINSGWLGKLSTAGVEIHIRSSFLQGLLLIPRDSIPSKFKTWNILWDHWDRWLLANKMSPLDACISYVLSFPDITRVVVGVETQPQLAEIIRAASGTSINSYPEISSDVTNLINPANWNIL
ncbi:aldo/keto reductase [Reinekea forsetii]|uniref:Aldo/keto reductase n=1 Tax=Reinekea forsetii TaxID=1336806 RepID=A0A2K8KP92_9GAMM|nr:aldo/keto reductase [Reinekea forsetii]ATX76597.1 aldo/keto reductase [Reinekea forsetii]